MWTDLGIEARETIANALIPQECGIEIGSGAIVFERVSVMSVRVSPITLLRRKSPGHDYFLPNAVHDNLNGRVCGGYGA
jgi:hypothetical protein